jgi:SMI1 / KNR4 family (SUKH-1)
MNFQSDYDEIEALVKANPGVVLFAEGVDRGWIAKAEAALGLKFPPSFVEFLCRYGGATVGGEVVNGLLGLEFEDACGPDIVYNTLLDRQRGLDRALIVLVDNDGDEMFYLDTGANNKDDENPVVRVLSEAPLEREDYAPTFAQFLLKRVKFALAT